jgi:hypothetical protein
MHVVPSVWYGSQVGHETKEAWLAYAAEKAVMPLRDLANAASAGELAGRSEVWWWSMFSEAVISGQKTHCYY